MARLVQCIHLKKEAEGMDYAPYPGELGKKIYNSVSKEAWQLWMKHQILARQMENFFFGDGADEPMGYVPPSN